MIILVKGSGQFIMIRSLITEESISDIYYCCYTYIEAVVFVINLITSPENDVTLILWNLKSLRTNALLGAALSHVNCKVLGFVFVFTYICNANMVDMLCKKIESGMTRIRVFKISKSNSGRNIPISKSMKQLVAWVPPSLIILDYTELGVTNNLNSCEEIDRMVEIVRSI